MQERGVRTGPGKRWVSPDVIFGWPRLTEILDPQSGVKEQHQPRLKWPVDLMKGKADPVAIHLVERSLDLKVGALLCRFVAQVGGRGSAAASHTTTSS